MNSTIRTVLVFVALVAAVIVASAVYRKTATPPAADPAVEAVPIDESALHPAMQQGLAAMRDQRVDEAIAHFQAVPEDSNDFAAALHQLAVLWARQGNLDRAQAAILTLTRRHPDNPEALASLAWLFFLDGKYPEAELAALRALEIDPAHLGTRYNIGLYRVAQGSTQGAVRSYLRAMRDDPDGREVSMHQERLRSFHHEHPDAPASHYALAFFANSTQDRLTEAEELEHYLQLAEPGTEADAARQRLEEARKALGAS